jgi:prepilin-type N-terminal cleavage/methylation domain-containing protein
MRNICKGFTLVEMAVVVFLIGILATMGLSAANALLASSSISSTKKKQEIIKEALITYLGTNKRLPCPAIDANGLESRIAAPPNPRSCTGYFGLLPYQTLGLPKSIALDGWDDMFSYAVSQQWTLTFSAAISEFSTSNAAESFNIGDTGNTNIDDRVAAISPNIVAVVISHGVNGLGSFTSKGTQSLMPINGTDEFINSPNSATWIKPATLYQREYTEVNTPIIGAFDDVVLRLSRNELTAPLIKDGSLKSPEAQWAEQVDRINEVLISYMLDPANANCAPPINADFAALMTNNDILLADPWGFNITYNRLIIKLDKDGNATPNSLNPYTLATDSGRFMYEPSIPTFVIKYDKVINNNCP